MSSSYSYQKLSGADEEERPEAQPAGAAEQPQAQQAAPASHSLQNSQSQASAASAAAPQWQFPTVTATEVPYAVPGPQFVPQTYGGAALGGPAAYGGGLNGWALPEFISPRAYRGWRGSLFSIAGDGSSRDWSICCIGTWFPYILFGQNMQRALGLKYATQSMLYFLCVFFFRWLINMLAHLLISGRKLLQSDFELSTDLMYEEEIEDIEAWARCMYPYTITLSFAWVAMIVFFCYAGYRRIQIRHKFGLPGDDTLDYVSWMFCAPCALCQETRTLSFNNVVNGEWNGPSQQAYMAGGYPQGAYGMHVPAGYGLQLHPLNDNGVIGVPMGTPMQQPPLQRGASSGFVMGAAAPPLAATEATLGSPAAAGAYYMQSTMAPAAPPAAGAEAVAPAVAQGGYVPPAVPSA